MVAPTAQVFPQFPSPLKNEVITMLTALEEDIKPIVQSLIYISHAFYQVMNSLVCATYSNF